MVVAVVMAARLAKPLPGAVSAPGSSLVRLRQSVSSLIARAGRGSLDQVNHSAIKLVLGQLLLVAQNSPAEDEPLSVSGYSHCAADTLLEIFHSFLLVNFLNLMVLRVQGLHRDCPHIYQLVLYLKC